MAVYCGNLSGILPGLGTTIDEFPQDLLDVRGTGNFRARQFVDACDEVLGQSQGGRRCCVGATILWSNRSIRAGLQCSSTDPFRE